MQLIGGPRLGRLAGVDIHLDWSLLVIFMLISFSLATLVFPAWHPEWEAGTSWLVAIAAAVLFFASVLVHEMAHALVGRRFGMQIKRITLFMFGGMAHMESEPPTWRAELFMALAGPATSILLGAGFILLGSVAVGPIGEGAEDPAVFLASLGPVTTLLFWLGPINILLAVFNLVPGFPLDGGRALRAIMWGLTGDLHRATRWASLGGQAFAGLLIALGVLMMFGVQVPLLGTGLVGGLWLAFIGWFLHNAAVMSYRQLRMRESLENVPIERVMTRRVRSIHPRMTVRELVEEEAMPSGQRCFPVMERDRFLGIVSLSDLSRQPRNQWESAVAEQVMTPSERLVTVQPHNNAFDALQLIGERDLNQLVVVEDGRFVGFVRREDLLKWLSLHQYRDDDLA